MSSDLLTIDEFEERAKDRLALPDREFYRNGAGSEFSLRDSVSAFDRLVLRPRFLRHDVSVVSLGVRVYGEWMGMPVGVAPTAMHALADAAAEIATAKACEKTGCVFILSTMSNSSIEDVASAAPRVCKWFQVYMNQDHGLTERHIRRAEASDFKAIVLTIDLPVLGLRFGERRHKFTLPHHLRLGNFSDSTHQKDINSLKGSPDAWTNVPNHFDDCMDWEIVRWIKGLTRLPVLVKGLVTKEDAVQAVDHAVDGIIVSSHGSRQLDSSPAPIEALAEVVAAVDRRVPVFVDGGVRRGTDVLKALALGATAVFVGRPVLWGLSIDGQKGVEKVMDIFYRELSHGMALSGCPSLRHIDSSLVSRIEHISKL